MTSESPLQAPSPPSAHCPHTMGMDIDFDFPETEDAAEALKLRRAALRSFVAEITAAVMVLPMPETWLEADQAAANKAHGWTPPTDPP